MKGQESTLPLAMPRAHAAFVSLLGLAIAVFVAVGAVGVNRYGMNFWLYRGFAPPKDPSFVTVPGTLERVGIPSPALGGRTQHVDVYLPPGYSTSTQRYPVLYLLHGVPGRPEAFILTLRVGVLEDVLTAKGAAPPMIIVMPFGSTGTFTDKEWVNGVRPGEGWETFVARDVVRAIDQQYRTIPFGRARAIAGLSEGGYGALNIGLHHPGEFRVLESWSGYQRAYPVRSIFGTGGARRAYNSPSLDLPAAARSLRAHHVFVWFYSGRDDRLRFENRAFAEELEHYGVAHHYFEAAGGHTWAIWRLEALRAMLVADRHMRR